MQLSEQSGSVPRKLRKMEPDIVGTILVFLCGFSLGGLTAMYIMSRKISPKIAELRRDIDKMIAEQEELLK